MILRRILLTVLLTMIVGCVSKRETETKYLLPTGAKIGIVLNEFPEEFTHTHAGTTKYEKFRKTYRLQKKLKKIVMEFIVADLHVKGYKTQVVSANDIEFQSLRRTGSSNDQGADEGKGLLAGYRRERGIDKLILVYFEDKSVFLSPDESYSAGKFGLFSRSDFFGEHYYAFSFMGYQVFDTLKLTASETILLKDNPKIEGLNELFDVKDIDEKVIKAIESANMERIIDFLMKANLKAITEVE